MKEASSGDSWDRSPKEHDYSCLYMFHPVVDPLKVAPNGAQRKRRFLSRLLFRQVANENDNSYPDAFFRPTSAHMHALDTKFPA